MRQWAGQVDEILLVVDLHKGKGPRSAAQAERLPGLRELLDRCCAEYPHARPIDVDYSTVARESLAIAYFGGQAVPFKDWNGTAIYPYFYGLHAASTQYVLHLDSDMMFGGGSEGWVAEAVELLKVKPDALACSPLPGPPTADGTLTSQTLTREPLESLAYRDSALTTRVFLIDLDRLRHRVGRVSLSRPARKRVWQALADGNPPFDLAEDMVTKAMREHELVRIDFLGRPPGMWSVHPPYRSATFYEALPDLIRRIETGDVPELQRGDHDLNDSMIDWTGAYPPIWRRTARHVPLLLRNIRRLASARRHRSR